MAWGGSSSLYNTHTHTHVHFLTAHTLHINTLHTCSFDDGFGGANELKNNLLYNTCRESSDHGVRFVQRGAVALL